MFCGMEYQWAFAILKKYCISRGRENSGVWGQYVHIAMFKMDNQQGPIAQHMELCSMLCGSLDGRGVWGRWIHVCIRLSPFAVHLKLSQYC